MRYKDDPKAYHRLYYQAHKAQSTQRSRQWRATNKERHLANVKRAHQQARARLITQLGSKCDWCGCADTRVLQIDHKHGGGTAHRESRSSSRRYYQDILNNLPAYQLLCANCHTLKTYWGEKKSYKLEE